MDDEPGSTAFDRLLQPLARRLTPDAARAIASFRADAETQARIDQLAEKCNEGQLSSEEQEEYKGYVQAIDMIAILQDKAREALENSIAP